MPKTKAEDRRKYIRLNSVFPVEIYLKGREHLIQAFTRDVSLGGACLSVNDPDPALVELAGSGAGHFEIVLNLPFNRRPIEARVKAAWHEFIDTPRHRQLLIGVSYDTIDERDKRRIIARARRMTWLPRVAVICIVALAALLGASFYRTETLRARNQELIKRFYAVQETSNIYKRGVDKIDEQFDVLKEELRKTDETVEALRGALKALDRGASPEEEASKRPVIEQDLASAMAEKALLEEKIAGLRGKKEKTETLFTEAREKRRELDEATADTMYQWLKTHRNKFTGLVMSFEGDPSVRDWAFTYDQSLASQAFLISRDAAYAAAILQFYADKAKRRDGAFMNAYSAVSTEPTEDVVHMGPSLWVGIAAVQYANRTGDKRFLPLAEEIAAWTIARKDAEGGLTGGPGITWYSTEHNLDAYALFSMLAGVTKKDLYRQAAANTLAWIKENTYSKKDGSMKRGKGDATIATDTLAWAIAAIGPATLLKEGMDPDVMMKFAEDQCRITTTFTRPDGEVVEVTGFDFAKARNAPRGGVISTEWTAQMAMAFRIMSDFYADLDNPKRSEEYRRKAEYYLGELDKMVIASPSPSGQGAGCLPYASQPNADTGHGWRTPAGAATGSVSGTAYTLFAKKNYNPLALE